jgi:hypothetical protein
MLRKTTAEFEALERLVARLGAEEWKRPVPRPESRDPWTVKDALAHIVHWKHLTARRLQGLGRPPEQRRMSITDLNHAVWEHWRARPAEEVLAWHRNVHREVLSALESKPEAWFTGRERGPDWLGDLHSHSAAHRRRDIEAALRDR